MVIETKKSLSDFIESEKKEKKIIGLVPTMGALHDGHLSLIDFAYEFCDLVVVSVFVNPTQFNNPTDLDKYPRNLQKDEALLTTHNSKTVIFAPSAEEVYAGKIQSESYDFGSIVKFMEGEFRTGHFDGVGSVLKRLFDIVKPHKAFFGEKDFQQLMAVKKLVEITNQEVEIIGCPTSRNEFGLAQSSRNFRLNDDELKLAEIIHKALTKAKLMFEDSDFETIIAEIKTMFENEKKVELEYFSIASEADLTPTKIKDKNQKYRAFIAAFVGEVRLIDNMALNY
ncbi:pantoate--beta-alanine ligase [Psychroflexus aestuariivivens]|uniref:pantoate--beta-alanine ligase n=1 Tax=Psychroflexus aestuariivivens TaxID=1795040 RepID=UPI000FD7178C|nr:pantoate--beta-alanine ligase [Psychroflexus aestuariivivens]